MGDEWKRERIDGLTVEMVETISKCQFCRVPMSLMGELMRICERRADPRVAPLNWMQIAFHITCTRCKEVIWRYNQERFNLESDLDNPG